MRTTIKAVIAAFLFFTAALAVGVALADAFEDGRTAYKRGDYAAAVKEWRSLAEASDAEVQFYLGTMYGHGRGVAQDDAKAVSWYRKAADQRLAMAELNLGIMYENGLGVARDYSAAAEWFRRAAGQGDGEAQYHLGTLYGHGQGVPQDDGEALKLYRQGATRCRRDVCGRSRRGTG
jgi:TPR repeat protein